MKNSKALFDDFVNQLQLPDSTDEVQSVAFLVFENLFGLSRTQVMAGKPVSDLLEQKIRDVLARLNAYEPVQYILGEAWFFGRKFKVTPDVLIPRPETEELVQYVIGQSKRYSEKHLKIVDIGAGSGCIPVTLYLELPGSEVTATDISHSALAIATENSTLLRADIKFIQHNILVEPLELTGIDIVVSNPPYISDEERKSMKSNVLEFEPHLALFVDGNDPLLFYRTIAQQSKRILKKDGSLCVEINEHFGDAIAEIFRSNGFEEVNIIRDLQGKQRIVNGINFVK